MSSESQTLFVLKIRQTEFNEYLFVTAIMPLLVELKFFSALHVGKVGTSDVKAMPK